MADGMAVYRALEERINGLTEAQKHQLVQFVVEEVGDGSLQDYSVYDLAGNYPKQTSAMIDAVLRFS